MGQHGVRRLGEVCGMCWQQGTEKCQRNRTWRSVQGTGTPDQLGSSWQAPLCSVLHHTACQAGSQQGLAEGELLSAHI